MSTEELLSLSNNKLLKNSKSSDEEKAEYMRKTLLLRDITSDLPRDSINSVISMANNVVNFFSLGIVEKDSFPTLKDNSVLKDSEKYGEYSSKEDLTNAIQENKKELYLKTGTYNPSANFVADTIVDIASFALLNKVGMNSTAALATSSAINTLGETGSVEDASKSIVSSYLFSKILDSKLTNKIQETSSGKISKFIENISARNPEIINSQLKKNIAKALPDVLSTFTSVGISRGIAGESNAIMQHGKDALNSDAQKNIFLDSMVWAAFSAGLTGYKGVKLKIENKEMEKAKIDNLYKDLGLDPTNTYTIDELNAQYKKLSKQNHPDLAHGDEKLQAQYTERMQQINSSYNQLKQYLTEHKLYEPEFKAFPTNDDIDVGYILKNLDDGVKVLKDNTIYVDTNNALMNTAKSIANSQIINTTVPIIQDNQVVGFSKERVVPFNVENSKVDVFPGITLSEDGAIDVIDINSGAKLLTNAKDIQTAINTVADGLRSPDDKTMNFINNSINKSKFESLKAIEQIASTIQDRASQIEINSNQGTETLQDIQKSINSIGNDTVYSNEDTKNILNYVNDNVKNIHSFEQNGDTYVNSLNQDGSITYQQKLDKDSYKGIEIKEIVNNAIQNADLSDINAYTNNNVKEINNSNMPETKISNSNREITNYTDKDIKNIIEPFSVKNSYTKKEVANIWNNISEKNYDATYDKDGNIEKYIAIENDGRNIVVNKYNNNDEIEKSIAIQSDNGYFSAADIKNAVVSISGINDDNVKKPISETQKNDNGISNVATTKKVDVAGFQLPGSINMKDDVRAIPRGNASNMLFEQNLSGNSVPQVNNSVKNVVKNKHKYAEYINKYKELSKKNNKIDGDIVEINTNIFDGISKKKQSQLLNEYLKNEVKGKDYIVGLQKIIATSKTIGKLKNGKTNFDKHIDITIRDELKANIIGNLDNIIKKSKIYQSNLPDKKNHSFADFFDRRKSIIKYGDKKYEVMFEIGKKDNVNTLYSIENIKITQKNRLSLPKQADKSLPNTNNIVGGSHKSNDSIANIDKNVKSHIKSMQKKDLSSPKLVSKRDLQNTNNGMRVY